MPLLQTLLLHVIVVVLVFPVVALFVVDDSGPDMPGKFSDPLTKSCFIE